MAAPEVLQFCSSRRFHMTIFVAIPCRRQPDTSKRGKRSPGNAERQKPAACQDESPGRHSDVRAGPS